MQANFLPFYTSMTTGWGQKVKTIFFLKKVMLHIKLKGSIKHYASKMFDLMHTPDPLGQTLELCRYVYFD